MKAIAYIVLQSLLGFAIAISMGLFMAGVVLLIQASVR